MRVELVRELDPGDDILEVPWARPDGPPLHYVDLKQLPGGVEELQECRQHPSLSKLLRQLNQREAAFRTVKCDVWRTAEMAADERADFNLPFKVGAYLDVVLESPELRTQLKPYLHWSETVARGLAPARLQAQIEIVVRRCLFHCGGKWGYAMTFFVHGYGTSWEEAENEWQRALVCLGKAMLKAPGGTPKGTYRDRNLPTLGKRSASKRTTAWSLTPIAKPCRPGGRG